MYSNNEVLAAIPTSIATFIQTNETEKQLEECLFSISEMDDIFVLYILNILNRKRAISNFDLRQKISGHIDTVCDKTPSEFQFHFRLTPSKFEVSIYYFDMFYSISLNNVRFVIYYSKYYSNYRIKPIALDDLHLNQI